MYLNRKKRSVAVGGAGGGAGGGVGGAGGGAGGGGGEGSMMPVGEIGDDAPDVDPSQDPNRANPIERLKELADRLDPVAAQRVGDVEGSRQQGLMDPSITDGALSGNVDISGGGVATYGWKMYEDEHERIMREQDVQELLQRLREAAAQDPKAAQNFLDQHPNLAAQISAALFAASGQGGNGVGITPSGGTTAGGGFGGWA